MVKAAKLNQGTLMQINVHSCSASTVGDTTIVKRKRNDGRRHDKRTPRGHHDENMAALLHRERCAIGVKLKAKGAARN
jgi:hypothetical protein